MRLGIDMDGVCADFGKAANDIIAKELGVSPITIDRWDWYKGYGDEVGPVWESIWTDHVADGLFAGLEPIDGALEGLEALRSAGHTVIFVTARPTGAATDTALWLDSQGFGDCPLILTTEFSTKVHVDVDVLLDDMGDTILRHLGVGKAAVLFKQHHNREWWHRVPSVGGWSEFVTMVEKLANG